MRPISPNTGAPETVVGEEQPEYLPISVAFYPREENGGRSLVTAWVPQIEELHQLAQELVRQLGKTPIVLSDGHAMTLLQAVFKAHPIYVKQLTFKQGMTPIMVSVGPEPWMLVGDRAPTG